jgi:hypothetical protein
MRAWILRRRWLCAALAGVLLFGQLAAAAYACPAGESRAMQPSQTLRAEPVHDCTGQAPDAMDPAQPLLCKAHCQPDGQSVNSVPAAAGVLPPALVDAVLVRVLDVADAEALAAAMPPALAAGPPAGSPPIYLSLRVLRN